jgi:hypothetical protein
LGETRYNLSHISFFEFLLAVAVWNTLQVGDAVGLFDLFLPDLSREVRHFVVGVARGPLSAAAVDRLKDSYRDMNVLEDISGRLRAQNLIIYFLSRLAPHRVDALEEICLGESNVFLQTGVTWALCHVGSRKGLQRFLAGMIDEEFRACCRGYVRYYYGDIDFEQQPPYLDRAPYHEGDVDNTVASLGARLLDHSYRVVVTRERQYVDLATYIDLLVQRNLGLDGDLTEYALSLADDFGAEGAVLRRVVEGVA